MSEDFSKGILFSVVGLVVGGVIGALCGAASEFYKVSFVVYAGFGFITVVVAVITAIMGMITNGGGGLITGLVMGIALGGVLDYLPLPIDIPATIVGGWGVGSAAGLLSGLVGALFAPPESKIQRGRPR